MLRSGAATQDRRPPWPGARGLLLPCCGTSSAPTPALPLQEVQHQLLQAHAGGPPRRAARAQPAARPRRRRRRGGLPAPHLLAGPPRRSASAAWARPAWPGGEFGPRAGGPGRRPGRRPSPMRSRWWRWPPWPPGAGERPVAPPLRLRESSDRLPGARGRLGPGPAAGAGQLRAPPAWRRRWPALVATTQDLRVLTTSRAPLGLSSESVYPPPEPSLATAVELFNSEPGRSPKAPSCPPTWSRRCAAT